MIIPTVCVEVSYFQILCARGKIVSLILGAVECSKITLELEVLEIRHELSVASGSGDVPAIPLIKSLQC